MIRIVRFALALTPFALAAAAPAAVLRVPADYSSVSSAVQDTQPGDRVEIGPGTYSPSATGESFPIELSGADVVIAGAGAGRTFLEGEGRTPLLVFRGGDASRVSDLTLAGGYAEEAGGAVRILDADPELTRLRLTGHDSDAGGDALLVDGGRPRVSNCLLVGNGREGPTVLVLAGNPVFERMTIYGNAGAAFEIHGDASPVIRRTIVSDPGDRGGVSVGVQVVTGAGLGVALLEQNLFEGCFEGTVAIRGEGGAIDGHGILAGILEDARRLDGLREGHPQFVSPADGDFRLREGSPARDRNGDQLGAFGGDEPLRLDRDDAPSPARDESGPGLLGPSVPNPFTPATTIHFTVTETGVVDLGIFNVLGQRIRTLHTGDLSAGEHSRVWDGRDDLGAEAPPGIYFVRITQGDVTESRRLVLVR